MTLQPFQYQLGDVVFGRDTSIPVSKIDIQTYNVNAQDFQVQRSDENRFGIDTLAPGPIIFNMSVMNNFRLDTIAGLSSSPFPDDLFANSGTVLADLAKEWKDPPLRLSWGTTKPLLFCDRNGDVRRVYGRPGKFAHTPRNKSGELWVDVQAEFRRADTYAHSNIEWYVGPLAPGGSAASVERIDGNADSWLRFTIQGPATNPIITYGDNVIETNSVIPAGVLAEISSYPWARRYIDDNNVNRRTEIIGDTLYLDQIKFAAGDTIDVSWTCTGSDTDTGLLFFWREAYNII